MIPLVFFLLFFLSTLGNCKWSATLFFFSFLVTVCLDIGRADGLLCRRITATWSGKDIRLYSASRQRIPRQWPCTGFETVGCPMQNPSDESVLLAVIVRMTTTSGSALDTFARFHFSNSIHLCNNFLGWFFATCLDLKTTVYYTTIPPLISTALEEYKEAHMHHILISMAHESNVHENMDLRSNAGRRWGEKGWI